MEIRKNPPVKRNLTITNYKNHKDDLRQDFNERCAYCNDPDSYCGGKRNYHIDHFAPKSLFPNLTNVYSNLLYSCPYCNNAKSNKWMGPSANNPLNEKNEGFCDPCTADYYTHLKRNKYGFFVYTDITGKYMYENLNLFLIRHSLIYTADLLDSKIEEVNNYINKNKSILSPDKLNKLLKYYSDLTDYFYKTWKDLTSICN